MKKDEISALMLRLFAAYDQADIQDDVYKLMASAPVSMQKEFINALLRGSRWNWEPDEEDLIAARKVSGYDGDITF